jgi:hypothetical protein
LSEDGLDLILRELKNGWNHKWLDERGKGILVWLTLVFHLGGLKLSEEHDGFRFNSLGLGASGILDVNEGNLVLGGGICEMSLGIHSTFTLSEICNDEFVVFDSLGKSIAINGEGCWARLLGNPRDNGVCGSSTGVLSLFSVPKIKQ